MPVRNSLLSPENEVVGDKVAAEILGIDNYRTLSNWRTSGKHLDLPYIRIGRSIRYRVGDLIEFRKRHTVGGVKAVEPAIEHAEDTASTQVKASSQNTARTSIAIATEAIQVVDRASALVMHMPKASGHIVRPSELVRKELNI
jgi:nicotinic acid mononucleotide adenylyltransferase